MWQNVKSGIAFFCILIYIAAVAFAGVKIYEAVNEQRFTAREEFADLTDLASRAGTLGLFTDEYIEDIKTQLDMSKALDALIIYGPDDNKFAFEKRTGLISYRNNYPDFNRKARLYRAPQSAPVRTEGSLNVSISAISPLIDFNTLLSVLRLSLLAVIAAVSIAFVTLIIDVCMTAGQPAPNVRSVAASQKLSDDELTSAADEEEAPLTDGLAAEDGTPPAGGLTSGDEEAPLADGLAAEDGTPPVGGLTSGDEEAPLTDGLAAEDGTPPAGGLDVAGELATADETPHDEDRNHDRKKETPGLGLLAAASALYDTDGFDSGGEDLEFTDILQSELSMAEANGRDLVLLNIEWTTPGLSCKPLIKQAAPLFAQGSRFFEKDGQEGLYIIVPDCGLDEAFARVKEFHKYGREKKPPEVYAELLIGMTARSLRSVGAINFLNEAEHAVEKARLDSALPIVAFKVDPQKYNKYTKRSLV